MAAIGTTWQLSVIGIVAETQHIHTLHFRAKIGTATPQNLVNSWTSGPSVQYKAMFSLDDRPIDNVKAIHVCGTLPLDAGAEETPTGANATGSRVAAAEKEPAFLAAVVREGTALAGRSYRGRFFIGGLQDVDVTRNLLTSTYQALVATYNAAIMALYGPSGTNANWQLVVHSRKLAQPGVDCLVSSTPVTSLTVNPRVSTQRSRKLGHGL